MEDTKKPEKIDYAFPATDSASFYETGMTLRDYFAAKCLNGMLCSGEQTVMQNKEGINGVADLAYRMADAMLERRK